MLKYWFYDIHRSRTFEVTASSIEEANQIAKDTGHYSFYLVGACSA